ncbi:MAG: hypothetical protein SGPRY_014464, partial [Prymnesium sp.]
EEQATTASHREAMMEQAKQMQVQAQQRSDREIEHISETWKREMEKVESSAAEERRRMEDRAMRDAQQKIMEAERSAQTDREQEILGRVGRVDMVRKGGRSEWGKR